MGSNPAGRARQARKGLQKCSPFLAFVRPLAGEGRDGPGPLSDSRVADDTLGGRTLLCGHAAPSHFALLCTSLPDVAGFALDQGDLDENEYHFVFIQGMT